ncbi:MULTISPECIES: FtsK/SpoIIIE domain-containing protein [Bacillus]|uniref:FtsK/SpoIIIE domain-containing protein n=1 Tax=Bacillus TaxID=1386 RepID=UPI0002EE6CF0|nr:MULTISPECIES: FtsK/SpoIIIE domain-containing protein [Bacillus]
MLVEVVTSAIAAGISGWATLNVRGSTNDCKKIAQILYNAGLVDKDSGKARPLRPLRKSKRNYGTEYAYKFPMGYSFKEFEKKRDAIQDGLNSRSFIDARTFLRELVKLRLNGKFVADLRQLLKQKEGGRKTVELDFNGALVVRVYEQDMPILLEFKREFFDSLRGWEVLVGATHKSVIKHDFDANTHLIVAGTSGGGKSVFLKSVITTLVTRKPSDANLYLIDLKGGLAFNRFRKLPNVRGLAKNPTEALEQLAIVQAKMNERIDYLLAHGYEDVKEAGFSERYFVIIDEAADIAPCDECTSIIEDIARRGRAAGFTLIYCTQYATNAVLSSQVRQNVSAQLCFRLRTEIASRAVIDEGGAEKLPLVKGRAIYRNDLKTIVQTPYMSNKFIDETIAPLINIRARKEEKSSETNETTTRRTDSLIITETRLS